jgi:hypothetical protein
MIRIYAVTFADQANQPSASDMVAPDHRPKLQTNCTKLFAALRRFVVCYSVPRGLLSHVYRIGGNSTPNEAGYTEGNHQANSKGPGVCNRNFTDEEVCGAKKNVMAECENTSEWIYDRTSGPSRGASPEGLTPSDYDEAKCKDEPEPFSRPSFNELIRMDYRALGISVTTLLGPTDDLSCQPWRHFGGLSDQQSRNNLPPNGHNFPSQV